MEAETEEIAEIAQISFFLAKDEATFAKVLDSDKNVLTQLAAQQSEFAFGDAKCRFIYFETSSTRNNPPWLDFVNEQLAEKNQIKFSTRHRSANGILLVALNKRILIATFGRSAGSYLEGTMLEADFGIRAAMNMCGNEEVRQTKSQSHLVTPTQIDRQVSKPSDTFVFGFSEAEDLRYISAHMRGDSNVTLQGRDSLTVKVIGKNKITWETLIGRCRGFLTAYEKKDYETTFPNYKNFQLASKDEINELDEKLITALKARELHLIQLGVPEFISEEDYSFSYTNHSTRENTIYAFLDVDQLEDNFHLDDVTVEKLKHHSIYAYSHVEDRVLSNQRWQLYKCVSFEAKLGKKYFVLSDGRWLNVENDFYTSIVNFTAEVLHEKPPEPLFMNIDISDNAQKKNLESIFNTEVCKRRSSAILFDRAKLRIGEGGAKNKEFCDILDLTDDGDMRIIHCKPYKDSSSTSYLFAQAQLYCQAFIEDKTFLSEIRQHIAASTSPIRDKYLYHVKSELSEMNGKDYIVCLWLLYNKRDPQPKKTDMPLMAQYELKLIYNRLRNTLKFRDVILRFIPVQKTNYQTSKKPTPVNA